MEGVRVPQPQVLRGMIFDWLVACGFSSSDLGCPVGFGRLNGDRINGLFHLLINEVYWSYSPFINHLLTSWDIQVNVLVDLVKARINGL